MQAVRWCDRGCSNWFLPAVFGTSCRGQEVEAGRLWRAHAGVPGDQRRSGQILDASEVEPSGFARARLCVVRQTEEGGGMARFWY